MAVTSRFKQPEVIHWAFEVSQVDFRFNLNCLAIQMDRREVNYLSLTEGYLNKRYLGANTRLLAYIKPTEKRVLDIGCGTGQALIELSRLGHECTGLTLSEAEAEDATSSGLKVLVADCSGPLPFEKGEFDVIYMSHVLEHIAFPIQALKSLATYLSPTGRFIIAVPNIAHWRARSVLIKGHFPLEDYGIFDRTHLRFFTYWSARAVVEEAGLSVLLHKSNGHLPQPIFRKLLPNLASRIDSLATRLAPNLLGSETIIIAHP